MTHCSRIFMVYPMVIMARLAILYVTNQLATSSPIYMGVPVCLGGGQRGGGACRGLCRGLCRVCSQAHTLRVTWLVCCLARMAVLLTPSLNAPQTPAFLKRFDIAKNLYESAVKQMSAREPEAISFRPAVRS